MNLNFPLNPAPEPNADETAQVPFNADIFPDLKTALIIVGAAFGAFVIAVLIKWIRTSRKHRKEQREFLTSFTLPQNMLEELSVATGVDIAHRRLLSEFSREWKNVYAALPALVDMDVVDTTIANLTDKWDEKTRREFLVRYRVPLERVLVQSNMDDIFICADLAEYDHKNRVVAPSVTGVGERDNGMYVLFAGTAAHTVDRWHDALPSLRIALDAPDAKVYPSAAGVVLLELNDAHLRANKPVEQTELPVQKEVISYDGEAEEIDANS